MRCRAATLLPTIAKSGTLSASEIKEAEDMLAKEAAVQAAEAKTGTSAASAPNKAAAPAASAANEAAAPAKKTADFVPTVQISEDLSVAFPADI